VGWKVFITKKAAKELDKLSDKINLAVGVIIEALEAEGIKPKGYNVKKLSKGSGGSQWVDHYRLRFGPKKKYRMIYRPFKQFVTVDSIEIVRVRHRKDAYK